jgi:hypothetical protein
VSTSVPSSLREHAGLAEQVSLKSTAAPQRGEVSSDPFLHTGSFLLPWCHSFKNLISSCEKTGHYPAKRTSISSLPVCCHLVAHPVGGTNCTKVTITRVQFCLRSEEHQQHEKGCGHRLRHLQHRRGCFALAHHLACWNVRLLQKLDDFIDLGRLQIIKARTTP